MFLRPQRHEQHPPSPDYVPGSEHADDEIVAEDQPYAEDTSPIAQLPDYVSESDPEADPEEDDDEDPEEDPIDYPADGGDDGDDEMDIEEDEDDDIDIEADEEDKDDEMDVEIEEEAEEEHSAPSYPVVVAYTSYNLLAPITILEPLPVPAWSDSEVARLLAISSPPASPLSPWSSSPPQIPFLLSPPSPILTAPPPSPIYAPPPLPTSAPTSFPPLLLPSDSHREDRPEVNLPPRMGLGIALGPRYEVGESSAAAAARPAGRLRHIRICFATMDRHIRRDPIEKSYLGSRIHGMRIAETYMGAPVRVPIQSWVTHERV
ncbi:hypothetical protein Tco_1227285 [Tanacetum coccineum]